MPAAEYVRMSTERQQYSIANQKAAIRKYAKAHGFTIGKTYTDAGRSGLTLEGRSGLRELLEDVKTGEAAYKAILVYDISRWGRFQNCDEAANYEFICKRAGIPVYYCAEQFTNDGTLPSVLMKSLKREMAAEYSRELGAKVFEGQRRLAYLGFRMGGPAGFGLRRLAISADRKRKRILQRGEWKGVKTDRLVLVPGPERELEVVRRIFRMAVGERKMPRQIAEKLNREGVKYLCGRQWNRWSVLLTLTNPQYAGYTTWGRTTQKLHAPQRKLPQSEWVNRPAQYAPIISRDIFRRAQALVKDRRKDRYDDEWLLRKLKAILRRNGKLSFNLIAANAPPRPQTYKTHFGSLQRAYTRVGYSLPRKFLEQTEHLTLANRSRKRLLEGIKASCPQHVRLLSKGGRTGHLVEIDGRLKVQVLFCRETRTKDGARAWLLKLPAVRKELALVCLLSPDFRDFFSLHVVPTTGVAFKFKLLQADDPWLSKGRKLTSLEEFCRVVREMAGLDGASCLPVQERTNQTAAVAFAPQDDSGVPALPSSRKANLGLPTRGVTPAAQYLRMSTDLQPNSIVNQREAIQKYASDHGLEVVRTYEDPGRSGLSLKQRPGLRQLLQDVVSGQADYRAIVVCDVSRWGRFLDPDEAAHYEFLCTAAGVPIHYCAEPFVGEQNSARSVMKAMKRIMAAEFSRELGAKVYEGKRRLAQLGFRLGGVGVYGLRRMAISPDGRRKHVLRLGESKATRTDRVVTVPGPPKEVQWVRWIFDMAVRRKRVPAQIARALNRKGVPYQGGRPWTDQAVWRLLRNPEYAGCATWGRNANRLQTGIKHLPPSEWIRKARALRPIVSEAIFERAQHIIEERKRRFSDERLLERLRKLWAREGSLSAKLLNRARGFPNDKMYSRRFGSLLKTYQRIGYKPRPVVLKAREHLVAVRDLLRRTVEDLRRLFPEDLQVIPVKSVGTLVEVDHRFPVLLCLCRQFRCRGERRWMLQPRDRQSMALVCLLSADFTRILESHVVPPIGNTVRSYKQLVRNDPWFARGKKLDSLGQFCALARDVAGSITPHHQL
jgi:DNA invertase Pin-like site-specific DNA recombinase